MAADMKEMIARAAVTLLKEKKVKRLTVKDIVSECHITRQAFYYHFEDIPDLVRWIVDKSSEELMQECLSQKDIESGLRYFFAVAVSARPLMQRGLHSDYRDEFELLLTDFIYRFFERAVEELQLYSGCSHFRLRLLLRYHSQAIMGILRTWSDADTKHMDEIVHDIYLMSIGEITP